MPESTYTFNGKCFEKSPRIELVKGRHSHVTIFNHSDKELTLEVVVTEGIRNDGQHVEPEDLKPFKEGQLTIKAQHEKPFTLKGKGEDMGLGDSGHIRGSFVPLNGCHDEELHLEMLSHTEWHIEC